MSFKMDRKAYASLYGPTVGDSVRLGDTEWVSMPQRQEEIIRR